MCPFCRQMDDLVENQQNYFSSMPWEKSTLRLGNNKQERARQKNYFYINSKLTKITYKS